MMPSRKYYNQNWLPSFFNDFFDNDWMTKANATAPAINVIESESDYKVEVAAPGMTKDDFQIHLSEDNELVISMEKKNETKEEKEARGKCIHKERYTGTCNRSFYVGEDITQEDIKAAFKDGVLRLQLPKEVEKQEEQPKLITIE